MSEEIVQKFQSRVQGGALSGVTVTYRASGGMPEERGVAREMNIIGGARARARLSSPNAAAREAEATVDADRVQGIPEKLSRGPDELVPRKEARFLPIPTLDR